MPKPPLPGEVASSVSEDDGEVVQSSTCVIPLTLTASFVQPLSLASARQLPQGGSPWQRGFVSDETKWSGCEIIENVTARQSLPCQGRWHRAKRRCRRGSNLTRNSLNKNQHRKLTGGWLYHLATCSAADSRLPDQRGGGAVPPHGGRLLRLCAVG